MKPQGTQVIFQQSHCSMVMPPLEIPHAEQGGKVELMKCPKAQPGLQSCPAFLEDKQSDTSSPLGHGKGTEDSGQVSSLTQVSTFVQLISGCLLAFPALLRRGESPHRSGGERRGGQLPAGLQQARAEESH